MSTGTSVTTGATFLVEAIHGRLVPHREPLIVSIDRELNRRVSELALHVRGRLALLQQSACEDVPQAVRREVHRDAPRTFYPLPSADTTALWVARTQPGFLFNVKAYGVLTAHHLDAARLPEKLRKLLPSTVRSRERGRDIQRRCLADRGDLEDAAEAGCLLGARVAGSEQDDEGRSQDERSLHGRTLQVARWRRARFRSGSPLPPPSSARTACPSRGTSPQRP